MASHLDEGASSGAAPAAPGAAPSAAGGEGRPRRQLRLSQWLSYLLGAFTLLAVLAAVWVNARVLRAYERAIETQAEWTRRFGAFSALAQAAGEVNAPGNDVFDSLDVPAESARLEAAHGRYRERLAAARRILGPGRDDAPLLSDLDGVEVAMGRMRAEAEIIFNAFRGGDSALAGSHMASMDRTFAELNRALRLLDEHARDAQSALLGREASAASAQRRVQLALGALLLAVVAGVVAFGRGTGRQLARLLDELDARHRDVRLILDHVDQGLVTVDPRGVMSRERSLALTRWFGAAPDGATFWSQLCGHDPIQAHTLELSWRALSEDDLPRELLLDQLPRRLYRDGATYAIAYHSIAPGEGAAERTMLVISDISESLLREKAEQEQRALMSLFQRAMSNRRGFLEFYGELEGLVQRATAEQPPSGQDMRRLVHTIKGNCSVLAIGHIVSLCHELEGRLAEEGDLERRDLEPLAAEWSSLAQKLGGLIGAPRESQIEIDEREYEQLLGGLRGGASRDDLLRKVGQWRMQPARARLEQLADQLRDLGARLGRCPIAVEIDAEGVRLDADRWMPFWGAFTHVVRNTVDHGIETSAERAEAGKAPTARVVLRAKQVGADLMLEISDDGRGIDYERVAERARAAGLPHETASELNEALFSDGLSTREEVTEHSGRGVGMGAVRAATEELGGHIDVRSERGAGTRLRFVFPARPTDRTGAIARRIMSSLAPRTLPPAPAQR